MENQMTFKQVCVYYDCFITTRSLDKLPGRRTAGCTLPVSPDLHGRCSPPKSLLGNWREGRLSLLLCPKVREQSYKGLLRPGHSRVLRVTNVVHTQRKPVKTGKGACANRPWEVFSRLFWPHPTFYVPLSGHLALPPHHPRTDTV